MRTTHGRAASSQLLRRFPNPEAHPAPPATSRTAACGAANPLPASPISRWTRPAETATTRAAASPRRRRRLIEWRPRSCRTTIRFSTFTATRRHSPSSRRNRYAPSL